MKDKRVLVVAALAAALVGGVALAAPAFAHGPGGLGGFGRGLGHGGLGGERGELLAQELGISVAELQAARLRALEKGLAEAVSAGRITQEQADLALAGAKLHAAIDHEAVMAEALGLTKAELEAARATGKTLPELMREAGLDRASFRTQLEAAMDKAIAQAVADGVITQAQADALKAKRGAIGPGLGRRGGPGGPGLPGGRQPRSGEAPEAPVAPVGDGL
jgi:hypothetical protein